MILVLHIMIALASVLTAVVGFMLPSKAKLYATYVLIAMTLTSGTYLVLMAPAHMADACVSGLLYTLLMVIATLAVRRKIALAADRA